jgi:hypothetical protein
MHARVFRSRITDTDRAVLKLKTQRRQLNSQRSRARTLIILILDTSSNLDKHSFVLKQSSQVTQYAS